MAVKVSDSIEVRRGNVYRSWPEDIGPSKFRGRAIPPTQAEIDTFGDRIAAEGQLQAIVTTLDGDKKPHVIAGESRRLAILSWNARNPDKRMMVDYIIETNVSDEDAFSLTLSENKRFELSPIDIAANIRQCQKFGWPTDKLVLTFCMSPARIAQIASLNALPGAMKQRVHSGEMSIDNALAYLGAPEIVREEVRTAVVAGVPIPKAAEIRERTRATGKSTGQLSISNVRKIFEYVQTDSSFSPLAGSFALQCLNLISGKNTAGKDYVEEDFYKMVRRILPSEK